MVIVYIGVIDRNGMNDGRYSVNIIVSVVCNIIVVDGVYCNSTNNTTGRQ